MLRKILLKPGINKEQTRYSTEGGWYDCDKVRFRQGLPEKIGGWARISTSSFLGVCRGMHNWVSLDSENYLALGTHLKYYVEEGGTYNDITPIRSTVTLNNPFTTTNGSAVVTVADAAHGAEDGAYVTFSGAASVGGLTLNGEYVIDYVDANTSTNTASSNATSSVAGGGGATVSAAYQINPGGEGSVVVSGWGSSTWGSGTWGVGTPAVSTAQLRMWSHDNFGEDLVFNYRGGGIYYWDASAGLSTRAVEISSLPGASNTPEAANYVLVSDNRFVFAFGTWDYLGAAFDPMLVRWSQQESVADWTPGATSSAGSLPLSTGSQIIQALQAKQEILVWTDAALYALQYLGYPDFWGQTLVGENISIISPRAAVFANGAAFWMGRDKFYVYDGATRTLNCDVRRFVFQDMNVDTTDQIFSGTNEGFNEVWWFYCSAGSDTVDRYVVYNYAENFWYVGSMARTAWCDTGLRPYPMAATYSNNIVYHEYGQDDDETGTPAAIEAYVTSSEFDLDDGDHFMFVRKVLPDVTFEGSTADSPSVTLTLMPLRGSGSGYNSPLSVGGESAGAVTRTASGTIEEYTDTLFIRIRGRQAAMKVESDGLGVAWQFGAVRLDMRADGKK